ncbi:UpxY family transcription antiterminator [Aquimarina litoralis]|uniref:UpxY family transcription antiterminator n=1 Tax=Aquimarina litoralis TaxID=584605 RepID=A0ABP3TKN0_9FLAO
MRTLLKTGWYVLYVRSRQENTVGKRLKEKGLESFVPMIETLRKWSDRKKIISVPLFSSYVFVRINNNRDLHDAMSVEGACSFITCGKEYSLATDQEIEQIKFLINSKDVQNIQTDNRRLLVGEMRMIEKGSLSGLECEIININNENKIIVRLSSINQSITATLPSYYLSKIPSAV